MLAFVRRNELESPLPIPARFPHPELEDDLEELVS